jgi:hypothetical protein
MEHGPLSPVLGRQLFDSFSGAVGSRRTMSWNMALRYRGWMLEYLVCSSCSGYSRVGARVLCSEYALNSRFKSFFVLLRNTIMEQALGTSGVERMKSPKKGSPCGKVSQNQASFPASCVHDLIFTCGWRHLPHPHLYSRPSCSE